MQIGSKATKSHPWGRGFGGGARYKKIELPFILKFSKLNLYDK